MFFNNKIVIIVSGPSGVGKTTICNCFLDKYKNFNNPISITTRPPRDYEINGKHYHFVTMEEYNNMLEKGELLESVTIYGNKYGTQSKFSAEQLQKSNLIFNVDSDGMKNVRKFFQDKAKVITIFILPPSIEVLHDRLTIRGDDENKVLERVNKARSEIQNAYLYDYVIMNDELNIAEDQFFSIYETFCISLDREYFFKKFNIDMK